MKIYCKHFSHSAQAWIRIFRPYKSKNLKLRTAHVCMINRSSPERNKLTKSGAKQMKESPLKCCKWWNIHWSCSTNCSALRHLIHHRNGFVYMVQWNSPLWLYSLPSPIPGFHLHFFSFSRTKFNHVHMHGFVIEKDVPVFFSALSFVGLLFPALCHQQPFVQSDVEIFAHARQEIVRSCMVENLSISLSASFIAIWCVHRLLLAV